MHGRKGLPGPSLVAVTLVRFGFRGRQRRAAHPVPPRAFDPRTPASVGGQPRRTGWCCRSRIVDVSVTQAGAPPNRPAISTGGIVDAASFEAVLAPGKFATVSATNLPKRQSDWAGSIVDGRLPVELDGLSLKIGGKECYLSFVGSEQVNALLPPEVPLGEQPVELTTRDGTARSKVTVVRYAPGLFAFALDERLLPVAQFANTVLLVVPDGTGGIPGRPAKAGDYLQFYATGFGPTAEAYPAGEVLTKAYAIEDLTKVSVTVGGVRAEVQYAGLIAPGLYQVNIRVPEGIGEGFLPVVASVGGQAAQSRVVLPFTQ